jgi:hypothetical protein
MRCDKNSVPVRWNGCLVREGDRYKCPGCGIEIITGFGTEFDYRGEYKNIIPIEIKDE